MLILLIFDEHRLVVLLKYWQDYLYEYVLDDFENLLNVHVGATEKLRTLGNLKGKISNKVSTITKEHKFFTENTVCPTCEQNIEETSE